MPFLKIVACLKASPSEICPGVPRELFRGKSSSPDPAMAFWLRSRSCELIGIVMQRILTLKGVRWCKTSGLKPGQQKSPETRRPRRSRKITHAKHNFADSLYALYLSNRGGASPKTGFIPFWRSERFF
jgi:hypothetical protein